MRSLLNPFWCCHAVAKGKVYTVQAVGKSVSPARLWVENADGGEVVWDASPVLQKVQSEMSVSFLATASFVNVGVLFDVPKVGDTLSLQRMQLRLATAGEIKSLAAQIQLNQAGKVYNSRFLEGVDGWEKNDNFCQENDHSTSQHLGSCAMFQLSRSSQAHPESRYAITIDSLSTHRSCVWKGGTPKSIFVPIHDSKASL